MFSDSVLTVANGEIFLRRIFLKIGNSRRNIKLLVTGYVINYLTAVCHMPNRKGGKWPRDFNAWANACCEFLNRRRPLMSREITSKTWWTWHVISSPKKTACSSQDSFAYRPVCLTIEVLLFKILLFFDHWSNHLFQSNQRFQAIEIVNRPVPEKLDIFHINISWAFYAWLSPRRQSYPQK